MFERTVSSGMLAGRATEEHVIDILLLRRQIEPRHSTAAFRFKLDYQRAGLEVRMSGRYSPAFNAREFFALPERSDYEEAAYQRWRNAIRAVGMMLSDVLVTTVCHGTLPPRVKPLRQGLEKLADWYGLPDDAAAQNPGENSSQNIHNAAAR